ncbi:RNA-binding, Nab2-type zinc finger [Rhizoctonia solani]|uniref:RNA-binding, Nab2-type zinc finger n=1 Tax=Rhizoctonia solani TaxID=456999 RepID=A0A8H7M5Y7_9AGAM|nr:RNA-binding, Nab2-type zinc finger [Rhizoctonia solani]
MVSALWNACAAEVQDLESVQQQLKEPGVDLEIKDHTGTTALIQAVRNGHKDIIKALLAAGADINNASDQGKPETYTTDPEILALLQAKPAVAQPTYEGALPPYPYAMMPPPDGQPPMPPFPPHGDANTPGGVHNLPPADVARTIPCRYFPVCRYGSSCIFLHPQPSYFSGPPPPAPSHYTPMYPPHPYYMMRPGAYPHPPPPPGAATIDPSSSPVAGTQSFPPPGPISYPPPPNGAPPFSPGTNGAPFPPPVNGTPFSNGAPYPPPTNGAPYPPPAANGAPFSPASSGTPYTPATNGTPSPFGPPPFSPGSATPYSATTPYTPETPVNGAVNGTAEETQTTPAANGVNGTGNHLNGGFARRNGRGGRPGGAGMGGDDCRFPHVMPEPGLKPHSATPPATGDSMATVLASRRLTRMARRLRTFLPARKLPFAPGVEYQNAGQRVPNADDFPVLKGGSGSDKPAPVAPTNGSGNGLTAAQVLQAPAPAKKGKADSEVVGDLADALSKVHVNGLPAPAFEAPSTTPEITAVGA